MRTIKVRIWRITPQGRTLWAIAEFSDEEKALSWAAKRFAELVKRGYLATIQVA